MNSAPLRQHPEPTRTADAFNHDSRFALLTMEAAQSASKSRILNQTSIAPTATLLLCKKL